MAETTCRTPGCDKPAKDTAQEGMCNKCWRRLRETLMAMGLWEAHRERVKADRVPTTPQKRGYTYRYKRDGRIGGVNDLPGCIVDECPRYSGKFGGEGRCQPHFDEYRAEAVARGEQCPMTNHQRETWGDTPGFHIEDWPEDQHAGLSVDGLCSVWWGCDVDISDNHKTGRGLCGRHFQQWVKAYKRRGLKVPKRASGRDPRCTLPPDDEIVGLVRIHGSYERTAKAMGVSGATFKDFRDRHPELKARLEEVWRLLYKPRTYTPEEAKERRRQQTRDRDLKRRLVPQQRIDFGGVTEAEAIEAVTRAKELETEPCAYCRCYFPDEMQIDHVVALTRGGDVRAFNLASACRPCNTSKGNRDLDDFLEATVDARAARYEEWIAGQEVDALSSDIEVLAIETGNTGPVSTSPEQLCLAFPGEALVTSGDADAGPRPRARRARRGR